MKKRLLITSSLALALGLGVVGVTFGASQAKTEEVKATGETVTLYCKMTYDWWTAYGAAIGVHYWGGDTPTSWPGTRMSPSTEYNVWKATIPANCTGLMFTRINGSGTEEYWSHKTDDLTIPSDGKNLYTITSETDPGEVVAGSWSSYTEDVPDSDGYYIVGTKSDWKFKGETANATKMNAGTDGNLAQLLHYNGGVNESFKVRSYFDGVATWYGAANYDVGSFARTLNVYINSSSELYVEEAAIDNVIANDKARIWIGYETSNPFYSDSAEIKLWIHKNEDNSDAGEHVYTKTGTYLNSVQSNRRYDYFDVNLSDYTDNSGWFMTVQRFTGGSWADSAKNIRLSSSNASMVYYVWGDWVHGGDKATVAAGSIDSVDAQLAVLALCGIHNCSASNINGYNAFPNYNSTFVKDGETWKTVGNMSDYTIDDFASGDSSYSGSTTNYVNAYDKYVFVQNMSNSGGTTGISSLRFGLLNNGMDNNNTLIIVIIASVLAAAGIGGYFFFRRKKQD